MQVVDIYQNEYVIVLIKKSELSNAFRSIDKYYRLLDELEDIMLLHGKKLRLRLEED